MAQVFRVSGTYPNGKKFDDAAKVGGGIHDEDSLRDHYNKVGAYKGVKDLKIQLIGDDQTPAMDELNQKPIPPFAKNPTPPQNKALPKTASTATPAAAPQGE